jgi:hypothetical protein
MGELVSFRDVYARWGYSEIDSPHRRADYDQLMEDAAASRARRAAGVAFDQLCDLEREELAIACQRVRQFFSPSTIGTKFFEARAIDRPELASFRVHPVVSNFSWWMTFEEYEKTSSPAPGDARNVAKPVVYTAPADPLTVGCRDGYFELIDGFHRAVLFWRYAPPSGSLRIILPSD